MLYSLPQLFQWLWLGEWREFVGGERVREGGRSSGTVEVKLPDWGEPWKFWLVKCRTGVRTFSSGGLGIAFVVILFLYWTNSKIPEVA